MMLRITVLLGFLLIAMTGHNAMALADRNGSGAQDDLPLRTGDLLQILLPGEDAFSNPFQIDAQGNIVVPEIGPTQLRGLSVKQARELLRDQLSRVFLDLERFDLKLKARRLLLQVLGYVKEPGQVDLPGAANIQSAIKAAGGLQQGAQLDRFQLRRGDDISVFNYKKYLDTGDISVLPALQPNDILFVPASPLTGNVQVEFDARTLTSAGDAGAGGTAVKVFGEVQKPGVFSFKPGQSIVDLIMRAGGVTRYAGVEKIRVMNGAEPSSFDLKAYLDTGNSDLLPRLENGATVYIPIHIDDVKAGSRTVYVMGEVARPGSFEMTEGASFFDILGNAGGPNRYAETRQLRIIRPDGTVIPFDLASYTEGRKTSGVPAVFPGDAIFVPEKADQLEKSWLKVAPERAIQVIGQVNRPGRYEWSDEMSLLDLLAHAGGPARQADTSKVQILIPDGDKARPEVFDLEQFMQQGGRLDDLPKLKAGYTVSLSELPRDPSDNKSQWVRQGSDRSIYVMGAVGSPGRYAFNQSLNFLDIVAAADGPRQSADIRNIRISHRGGNGARVSKLNLALYFETGDDTILPAVRPGDVIYVPSRDRDWTEIDNRQTIRVLGSVGSPGRYNFDDSMNILDLLAESGGPSDDAWQEKIVVVNMVDGEPRAQSFDLVAFAKSGDFSALPVIRPGDTVYVPTTKQSTWSVFMSGVRDTVQFLSLFAVLGVL